MCHEAFALVFERFGQEGERQAMAGFMKTVDRYDLVRNVIKSMVNPESPLTEYL